MWPVKVDRRVNEVDPYLRQCITKQGYRTEQEAERTRAKFWRKYSILHTYLCPVCTLWHLGHRRQ